MRYGRRRRNSAKFIVGFLAVIMCMTLWGTGHVYAEDGGSSSGAAASNSAGSKPLSGSAYNELGFKLDETVDENGYFGGTKNRMTTLNEFNEMYFSYNGSSNYGTMVRENLDLTKEYESKNLKEAGAYGLYGYYSDGKNFKLKNSNGKNNGSLGGNTLYKNIKENNSHQGKAYETAAAYTSASGKKDRIATLRVTSSVDADNKKGSVTSEKNSRKEYHFYLVFSKTSSNGSSIAELKTVDLGDAGPRHPLNTKGNLNQEIFDALFDMTAGDFDGDGLDEVAVTFGTGEVRIYKDTGDCVKTIGAKDLGSIDYSEADRADEPNRKLRKTAVISLAAGDLKKDLSDDLAITVTVPFGAGSDYSNQGTNAANRFFNKNNTYIYGSDGEDSGLAKMKKEETVKLYGLNDGQESYMMRSAGTGIGDLNGDGIEELVIAGRLTTEDYPDSLSDLPIGAIHVEYDFGGNGSWEVGSINKMSDPDPNLNQDKKYITKKDNARNDQAGYLAPVPVNINDYGPTAKKIYAAFVFDRMYAYGSEDDDFTEIEGARLRFGVSQKKNNNDGIKTHQGTWVSTVASGKFMTPAADSSNQLAVIIGQKAESGDYYYYQMAYLSPYVENGELKWHRSWEGILNAANSYLNRNGDSGDNSSAYAAFAAPDVDEDSLTVKFLGTEKFYTRPEVYAVLQSAPYFQDVADAYPDDYLNDSETAYGKSQGKGNGTTFGVEASLGAYVSAHFSFIASGEFELAVSATTTYTHDKTKEVTTTQEYAGKAGDDYVVMYAVPYMRYKYSYTDEKGETQRLDIEEPRKAATVLVPADTYDAVADQYGLEKIYGNILTSQRVGEPATYTKTPSGGTFKAIGPVQHLTNRGKSGSSITVSQDVEWTSTKSNTGGVLEELEVGGGVGFLGNGAKVGIKQTFGIYGGDIRSSMRGISCSGTVENLPNGLSGYGFDWQLGAFETRLNGNQALVIGYKTSAVDNPPPAPKELVIKDIQSRQMTLEWNASSGAAVYQLMLIDADGTEMPQATIPATQVRDGKVSYTVKNLQPNTASVK